MSKKLRISKHLKFISMMQKQLKPLRMKKYFMKLQRSMIMHYASRGHKLIRQPCSGMVPETCENSWKTRHKAKSTKKAKRLKQQQQKR